MLAMVWLSTKENKHWSALTLHMYVVLVLSFCEKSKKDYRLAVAP